MEQNILRYAELEIKALRKEIYDVTEVLCEALGMHKDPEYGYPIGERTLIDLASEAKKRLQAAKDHGWNWD